MAPVEPLRDCPVIGVGHTAFLWKWAFSFFFCSCAHVILQYFLRIIIYNGSVCVLNFQ
jgi:hypothetical protein